MGKLPFIGAIASAMWALPASAGDVIPSKAEVALAQWYLCVGPDRFDETIGKVTIGATIEAGPVVK